MTTLQDAKHAGLLAGLGVTEGHVNDLEHDWLVALGATAGRELADMWWEVFDAAAVPAGNFNDRAVAYIVAQVGAPPSDDYNEHWRHYWQNATLGPTPPFPTIAPLWHWFDFADPATVFSDVAGTIPAVDGGLIRNVTNKGQDGTAILSPGGATQVPIYRTNFLNGKAVGDFNHVGQVQSIMSVAVPNGIDPSAEGLTIAAVARVNNSPAGQGEIFAWGGSYRLNSNNPGIPGTDDVTTLYAPGSTVLVNPHEKYAFYLFYTSVDLANVEDFAYASPGPEFAADPTNPSSAILNGTSIEIHYISQAGDVAECFWWRGPLLASERAALEAYVTAKYGALPAYVLPEPGPDLLHWFDFTDPLTVFKNPPATQIAQDGDFIRQVDNKGSDGTPLTSSTDGVSPILRENWINGQQIADFPATGKLLSATILNGHAASSAGISFAAIARYKDIASPSSGHIWEWGASHNAEWEIDPPVVGRLVFPNYLVNELQMETVGQINNYVLMYATLDAGGPTDDKLFASPGPETTPVDKTLADIVASATMAILNENWLTEIAEIAVWDGPLSATERAELVVYADEKYGTLPRIPVPPVMLNVQHWWDFTDQSTVFADTAGLVPITDGTIIQRVNDKGSGVGSGQPPVDLQDATSGATWHVSPGGGNPLPAARYLAGGLPGFLSQAMSGGMGGTNGMTVAGVWRVPVGFSATNELFFLRRLANNISIEKVFSNWAEEHQNQGTTQSNKAIVGDEWVWHYWTDGVTHGQYRQRVSGSAEVNVVQGYLNQAANNVELFHDFGEISEIVVWDTDLSTANVAEIINYFVSKYGAIFPP